jgi:hypothetical protein
MKSLINKRTLLTILCGFVSFLLFLSSFIPSLHDHGNSTVRRRDGSRDIHGESDPLYLHSSPASGGATSFPTLGVVAAAKTTTRGHARASDKSGSSCRDSSTQTQG